MKIYGLLNLKTLFLSNSRDANFENAVNASYKMSEDGALALIISGRINDSIELYKILVDKLDIPLGIYVKKPSELKKAKREGIEKLYSIDLKMSKKINIPKSVNELNGKIVLIDNRSILRMFRESEDFLPEMIAVLTSRLLESGTDIFVTEEVRSAIRTIKFARIASRNKYFK